MFRMNVGKTYKILAFLAASSSLAATDLFAKRSSELIYTEPFDLAAGGTTLTRASQEGIVFANPALLPLGAAYIRWLGFQTGFMLDRDLAEAGTTSIQDAANTEDSSFMNQLFSRSLHFGQTTSLGFLNKNVAVTAFNRLELDVEGDRFGNGGLPAIEFQAEAYAGGLLTVATQPLRWFSIGLTGKYLYAGEPTILVPVTDEARVRELVDNPDTLQDEFTYGQGTGADLGTLFLWQNPHFDLSLGLKVEDIGGTVISNDQGTIPQTYHAGIGMAFHGTTQVLHLSLDHRDIGQAHEDEKTFKKVYAGARLMLFEMIGVAVGLYQGIPTCGIRLDLYLLKLGITAYGRELGNYPGDKQRNMVMIYTSMGI